MRKQICGNTVSNDLAAPKNLVKNDCLCVKKSDDVTHTHYKTCPLASCCSNDLKWERNTMFILAKQIIVIKCTFFFFFVNCHFVYYMKGALRNKKSRSFFCFVLQACALSQSVWNTEMLIWRHSCVLYFFDV